MGIRYIERIYAKRFLVIYHRADAEKEFMGLMIFSGEQPTLKEAKIAKNYLNEKELRAMGQLVSGYLDFAERQAETEYKKYKQKTISSVEREYLDVIKQIQGDVLT